jgi:DNA-binding transcriptional LysR family regulator
MEKLKTIESFIKVARLKNFGLAAEQLGASAGLVSKHVSALEKRLGVLLLNRTTGSVSLSDHGVHYLEFCSRFPTELDTIEAEIASSNESPAGALRIMVPKSFGALHFADAVARFARSHSGITALILDDAP